jgi:hypothetical protein
LFNKLVPREGQAKTVEGELLRAGARVNYRYFNDGDKFFEGYGCETCGPSASYLFKSPIKDIKAHLTSMCGASDGAYEKLLQLLIKKIVDYVEAKGGKYTKNTVDSRDFKSIWTDEDEDDDEYDSPEDEDNW